MFCLDDNTLMSMLKDDCPFDDITTNGLGISHVDATADFFARGSMVLCGVEEAARLSELSGAHVQQHMTSGDRCNAGDIVLSIKGKAGAIHRSYKLGQTLMEVLSGISTRTNKIVQAAQKGNPNCHVTCTRKHMPGVKAACLKAVCVAGASPHRLGLSDFVLVFDQHRVLLPQGAKLIDVFSQLKHSAPERKLAVEADTVDEAINFAQAGADIVQMDKVSSEDISGLKKLLSSKNLSTLVSAAGGINENNAESYARAGADILVTSQPYYASPCDIKVAINQGR